jgi:hypothetical protein
MQLILMLRMSFPAGPGEWWKEGDAIARLAAALEAAGLWFDFRWTGREASRSLRPMASPARLADVARRWRAKGSYVVHSRQDGAPTGTYLDFLVNPDRLYFRLLIAPEHVEPRRATILDDLVRAAVALRSDFVPGGVRLGCACGVHSLDPYPSPRPPRLPRGWEAGALVDLVDRASYAEAIGGEGADAELARILAAPLPEHTIREEHGSLVVFRHARDVVDEEAVGRARRAQEEWITRLVPSPVAPFWNELGDEVIVRALTTAHPPLTAYDGIARAGFKAVFYVEGEPDPEELAELSAWARARSLPDGTPLSRLTLILTARSAALALAPRAHELGLDVAYADSQGTWWAPNLDRKE